MWADVESAVLDRSALVEVDGDPLGTDHTATRLPANIKDRLPLIRARRIGGTDERWQLTPRIVLEVYAMTRSEAWQVAEDAHLLLTAPGWVQGDIIVDQVIVESANSELPYPDQEVRQVVSTLRITARRQPALI